MKHFILAFKLLLCKSGSYPLIILELKNAQIRHVKGIENIQFIRDCADIVKADKLTLGLIYVVKTTSGTRLRTSSEIPSPSAQKLRNLWSFYS